jgi:hypothetical protein
MTTTQTKKQDITKQSIEKETADRLSRIDKEFADGFDIVNSLNKSVTVFGSARFKEGNHYYDLARDLSGKLAEAGYTTVTGGGGGIMEAGNRGAFEKGGKTAGFNISLPHEQVLNPYTTVSMPFYYFFTRKVILAYGAEAYVVLPGGFGTLDELFEIITLIQTKKMPKAPVILMGSEFWQPLDDFIRSRMLEADETISPGDEKLYTITDSPEEAVSIIQQHRETIGCRLDDPTKCLTV